MANDEFKFPVDPYTNPFPAKDDKDEKKDDKKKKDDEDK